MLTLVPEMKTLTRIDEENEAYSYGEFMKRRILLVDDELAILLTLKAIFELLDFEVETALSAKEAVSRLNNGRFHMVITDMKMEHDKAGYDVIHAAKASG